VEHDRPAVLRLPAIHAAEGDAGPLRVRLESNGLVQMRIDDPSWARQLNSGSVAGPAVEWRSDELPAEIPLTLALPQPEGSGEYVVPRALITTVLRADGTARCAGRWRFEGAPAALAIVVPGADHVRFWWDRRRLTASPAEGSSPDARRFVLTIPSDQRTGSRLLTVEYETPHGAAFGLLERQRLLAPQVAGVGVEQTLWQVVLPDKQHVFTSPAGFVPRYRWLRSGFFWSRLTPPDLPRPADWIGASAGPELPADDMAGYDYEFTRSGTADGLSFRTMSSAALIAAGAGFAWAVGFILLTVPRARNVLTVLTIGLAVAVVSAGFPAAIEVLLQPILLGLALAVAAASIDALLRRKRIATVITFSSPSDYAVASQPDSSADRVRAAFVGSNDATAMRPASSLGSLESLAAPDSGSRA
jgi:hypothetical protein